VGQRVDADLEAAEVGSHEEEAPSLALRRLQVVPTLDDHPPLQLLRGEAPCREGVEGDGAELDEARPAEAAPLRLRQLGQRQVEVRVDQAVQVAGEAGDEMTGDAPHGPCPGVRQRAQSTSESAIAAVLELVSKLLHGRSPAGECNDSPP